ncbi:MAG: protein phosphatase 2C domain-containing protein [Bacteroidales bacterium]|nr:protein phosphatase 2C domain-containing protein [Bacteroidales bacterium]
MYDSFIDYTLKLMWEQYKENYMKQEILISNKVNDMNIPFPNGTVGKEYKNTIVIQDEDVTDFWFEGLDSINLKDKIDDDTHHLITGIPEIAGTYDVKLCYKYKGWVNGMPTLERIFHISINPDPKTLWQNIPTSKDIEYYKEDSAINYVCVGDDIDVQKDIVVASQRGRSHANKGIPRDDDFRVEFCKETKWYVMAVADGAGSAKYSRKGSRVACNVAVEHCLTKLKDSEDFEEYIKIFKNEGETPENRKWVGDNIYDIVGNAALKAHKSIADEATSKGRNIKEYATTLLLAICKKFDFGWFVASFWVGDGALCLYDKNRQYIKLLGQPDGGEFAGQTRFLTMKEIFSDPKSFYQRLRFSIEDDFTSLMLMTDGVSDPKFGAEANLNKVKVWDNLWNDITSEVDLTDNNAQSANQLLKWLDFWAEGEHDDRTIAILY